MKLFGKHHLFSPLSFRWGEWGTWFDDSKDGFFVLRVGRFKVRAVYSRFGGTHDVRTWSIQFEKRGTVEVPGNRWPMEVDTSWRKQLLVCWSPGVAWDLLVGRR